MDDDVQPRVRVGIIGAGRVGRAFAHASRRAGFDVVAAWSRGVDARQRFAAEFGTPVAARISDATDQCDVVIVAVPDEQIDLVVRQLAEIAGAAHPPLVIVTSGSWSTDRGSPMVAVGGRIARLHPLRAITDAAPADVLVGVVAAVTAPGDADRDAARRFALRLEMHPVDLADADAATWHAAGTLAAGGVTTLLAAARDLATVAGMAPDDALRAMADLARGAIDSAVALGPEASLTGPVVRGDAQTVAAHVAALLERRPDLVDTYRAVSRVTAGVAHRAGRLDDEAIERIDTVLADHATGPAQVTTWA